MRPDIGSQIAEDIQKIEEALSTPELNRTGKNSVSVDTVTVRSRGENGVESFEVGDVFSLNGEVSGSEEFLLDLEFESEQSNISREAVDYTTLHYMVEMNGDSYDARAFVDVRFGGGDTRTLGSPSGWTRRIVDSLREHGIDSTSAIYKDHKYELE